MKHTHGPLPQGWTLKDGTIHYHEDDYHKYILDKSGRIDRNAVALTLENYGYQDHARRWFLSPAEMAAPELLHMLRIDLVRVHDLAGMMPERTVLWNAWTQDIKTAIARAEGGET